MTKIEAAFTRKPIFMPYYPVGYPDLATSIDVIEALAHHGADLVEIGLSFSDPLADGPVIQKAMQTALQNGITVKKSLQAVAELRRRGVTIPLVLMGYYNLMLAYGLDEFILASHKAGVDGFIVPDLPPEEADDFEHRLGGFEMPLIHMVAPTTPDDRLEAIGAGAQGFIYLVSVTGVTGARLSMPAGLKGLVARVRRYTPVPVCVGFGISTPEQARTIASLADGVIVGSAAVKTIGASENPVAAARGFASEYRLNNPLS